MTEKPVSQILEEAAEELKKEGWIKRSFGGRGMGYCSVGAIGTVLGQDGFWAWSDVENSEPVRALDEYLDLGGKSGYEGWRGSRVESWNDREERTQQEVLDAFINTAKQLRNEGR